MIGAPAFGLYPTAACLAAQKLAAGVSVPLLQPAADAAGVTRFRRSFWLPLPELLSAAVAARLVDSALGVRFAPVSFDVAPGNTAWMKQFERHGDDTRITLAWPAPLRRVNRAAGALRYGFGLHRADGDAVADDAAQSGTTGVNLEPPFVGTSFELRLGEPVYDLVAEFHESVGSVVQLRGARAAAAPGTGASPITGPHAAGAEVAALIAGMHSLSFDGVPTTPRLTLVAEQPEGAETLLWQEMLPGVQAAAVTLPDVSVDEAWQPAIDQLRKLLADPDESRHPERLRLDIESDAPCAASFTAVALALEAELELLAEPAEAAFDGQRPDGAALPVALPAGIPGMSMKALTLRGRVAAEAGADALGSAAAGDVRRGALVETGQAALHALDLAAPVALAGVTLWWRPLSSGLQARLRLLADGGGAPAARVLAEAGVAVQTSAAGWIAARWPAVDLQAQRVWVEWSVADGAGLWIFAAAGTAAGWVDTRGGTRRTLPEALAFMPLPAAAPGETARPVRFVIGMTTLADDLPEGDLQVVLSPPHLFQLAFRPIVVVGGTRGKVTVDSARLAVST